MWGAATGLWRGWRSKWGSVDVDEELEGCGERVVDEAAAVGCAAAGDVKVGRLWCGDAGNSANDDSESSFRRSLPHLLPIVAKFQLTICDDAFLTTLLFYSWYFYS